MSHVLKKSLLFAVLALLSGCITTDKPQNIEALLDPYLICEPASPPPAPLKSMGYTVQVGAFSLLDNAVRLEEQLRSRGLDAYYYKHESGLYKVRFGDHATYEEARSEAERLHQKGVIGNFFIVRPEDYTAARIVKDRRGNLRSELVKTARGFIGVPYRWGGESADTGFDCSGLAMVVYRLNGLNLPRNSRRQFDAGRCISAKEMKEGDLVFFATNGGKRVTHVGLYIGDGKFIHAPRKGKNVRIESLSNTYFAKRFVGSRTFL